jgi:hypothetical protein
VLLTRTVATPKEYFGHASTPSMHPFTTDDTETTDHTERYKIIFPPLLSSVKSASISVISGELAALQQCTHTGRPLGTAEFVKTLEQATHRQLAPGKGGRPAKLATDDTQDTLEFDGGWPSFSTSSSPPRDTEGAPSFAESAGFGFALGAKCGKKGTA